MWFVNGVSLRHAVTEQIRAYLTDCPPNSNKWLPNGGPGYEEAVADFMHLSAVFWN